MADVETRVVLIVHGDYGAPLVETAEAIVGPVGVQVVSICASQSAKEVRNRIRRSVQRMKGPVLFVSDICGSTPCNVCRELAEERVDAALVTGLNLPMLIKLSTTSRTRTPAELARELSTTGARSVRVEACGCGSSGGARGD